jgi:hypothetical protein
MARLQFQKCCVLSHCLSRPDLAQGQSNGFQLFTSVDRIQNKGNLSHHFYKV